MKRRDFLLFRRTRHARIIEIPCDRIYVRCLGGAVTEARRPSESRNASMPGESVPEPAGRTTTDDVETINSEMKDAGVVRVTDRHWLAATVSREFDTFLATFIARGGRVEFVDGSADEPA